MKKEYKELTIRDPFMFGKVTMDPKISQELISALMNEPVEIIDMPEREKFIQAKIDGKYVKLDLYVEDSQNRIYDAEMQNASKNLEVQKDIPVRTRVYQSMIDSEILSTGIKYRDVKECKIIFICTYDLFGLGNYKYSFQNRCREYPELVLNDKCEKIIYNTMGNLSEAPETTRNLFHYINSGIVSDSATKNIEDAVKCARENEEWGHEYMLTFVHDSDVREEGRLEGIKEGIKEGINTSIADMLRRGKTPEQIVDFCGFTKAQVQAVLDEMHKQ